jgi:hypothetical protein
LDITRFEKLRRRGDDILSYTTTVKKLENKATGIAYGFA